MTTHERRKIEAQYREALDARIVLAKCAAGLLVLVAIGASGIIAGAAEDAGRAAFSAPQVASGR
jgi:hypothetical protein